MASGTSRDASAVASTPTAVGPAVVQGRNALPPAAALCYAILRTLQLSASLAMRNAGLLGPGLQEAFVAPQKSSYLAACKTLASIFRWPAVPIVPAAGLAAASFLHASPLGCGQRTPHVKSGEEGGGRAKIRWSCVGLFDRDRSGGAPRAGRERMPFAGGAGGALAGGAAGGAFSPAAGARVGAAAEAPAAGRPPPRSGPAGGVGSRARAHSPAPRAARPPDTGAPARRRRRRRLSPGVAAASTAPKQPRRGAAPPPSTL